MGRQTTRASVLFPGANIDVVGIGNFNEINLGYSKEQAYEEASRCLRCDVRVIVNTEEE